MADDGRAFFATKEALVPRDQQRRDHRRLRVRRRPPAADQHRSRLARLHRRRRTVQPARATRRTSASSRSARDGTDVFFSTYETLVDRGPERRVRQVLRRPHQRRLRQRTRPRCPAPRRTSATAPTARRRRRRRSPPAATSGPAATSSRSREAKKKKKKKKKAEAQEEQAEEAAMARRGAAMVDGRRMSEETTMDMTLKDQARRCCVAALAMASVASSPLWVSSAQAEEPAINEPRIRAQQHPGRRAPGRLLRAHVEHVVQPRRRWRRRSVHRTPALPARARDRHPLADRVHRQPARRAEVHAGRVHACPRARSTRRSASFEVDLGFYPLLPGLQHGDPARPGGPARP